MPLSKIKAILIDLNGTLHVGNSPINCKTIPSLAKLRQFCDKRNIHIRYLTNTSKESQRSLYEKLQNMGFNRETSLISKNHIFTSLMATNSLLDERYSKPYYILTDSAMEDMELAHCNEKTANTVVIGLAEDKFDYRNMNSCFRILEKSRLDNDQNIKNPFISINLGRYHNTDTGNSLGPGCFSTGLEYSSGVTPIVVGKPSPDFFNACIQSISKDVILPEESIMIGDDSRDDVNGAIAAGLHGILVKTGKYQIGDEQNCPEALFIGQDFSEVVEYLIGSY